MEYMHDNPNKIYIKSNTVTVMRFLFFVSAILLVLVVGISIFVIFNREDTDDYYFDTNGQFYYVLHNGKATIVDHIDYKVTNYTIPGSVTNGGKNFPVTAVGEHAFNHHRSLTTITIPNSVTEITGDAEKKKGAFAGCTALSTVNLGQGVSNIGPYAFKNCVALESIELSVNVQYVQIGAFQNCYTLDLIQIDSNGRFSPGCFLNCSGVTTLRLAGDVQLNDSTRQALADLTGLANFEIVGEDAVYHTDENGHCLLDDADAVVLGGHGADVPAGVTKILDWAWAGRTPNYLFISKDVKEIGANSFDNQATIYTDAAKRLAGWQTTASLRFNAEGAKFSTGDGAAPKNSYIYYDGEKKVYPEYDDLFPDVVSETPFSKWELVDGIYQARYQKKVAASSLSASLEAALSDAKEYIDGDDAENVRLKFAIDFWEKFKALYHSAQQIHSSSEQVYEDTVNNLISSLKTATAQIKNALAGSGNSEILTSDWRQGMQDLLDLLKQIDPIDLDTAENYASIKLSCEMIKTLLDFDDDANVTSQCLSQRREAENLKFNLNELNKLIAECEEYEKLGRANYTKASWQKFQACLAEARLMTEHNLSISVVREALAAAREDLREVITEENIVLLNAWFSICLDLDRADYEDWGYNVLMRDLEAIWSDNETATNDKFLAAITTLQNDYAQLVSSGNLPDYQTGPEILNIKSLPYFIIAVILFSGAVVAGAVATRMKLQLRRSSRE